MSMFKRNFSEHDRIFVQIAIFMTVLHRQRQRSQQYEYGSKASIASTARSNLIVGVVSHVNDGIKMYQVTH